MSTPDHDVVISDGANVVHDLQTTGAISSSHEEREPAGPDGTIWYRTIASGDNLNPCYPCRHIVIVAAVTPFLQPATLRMLNRIGRIYMNMDLAAVTQAYLQGGSLLGALDPEVKELPGGLNQHLLTVLGRGISRWIGLRLGLSGCRRTSREEREVG